MSILSIPNDTLYEAAVTEINNLHRVGEVVATDDAIAVIYEREELGRRLKG